MSLHACSVFTSLAASIHIIVLAVVRQNEVDVSTEKGAVRTVTDIAAAPKNGEQTEDTGPSFDVFYYKANKEVRKGILFCTESH